MTPWDLYICVSYTLVLGALLLTLGVVGPVALPLILLAPGYVLVAAIFPGEGEMDWLERLALSAGLSIVALPLLGILMDFTPWGIRAVSVVGTTMAFTLTIGFTAYWRRIQLPVAKRLSAALHFDLPTVVDHKVLDSSLSILLCTSIVLAGAAIAYTLVTPRPTEHFTEFYVLGPGRNASGYPTKLNLSEPAMVFLVVVNHETAKVNYTLRVDLVGVRVIYNPVLQVNETLEYNRTTWSWFNASTENGQNWTQPYTFRINSTSEWKVQFLLFKDGDFSSPYQELHLFIRVSRP